MNTLFPLKTSEAKKIWRALEQNLHRLVKPLSKANQQEIKNEVLSHVYEATLQKTNGEESYRLQQSIDSLGDLPVFVKPLVQDLLLDQNLKQGRPAQISQGLLLFAQQSAVFTFAAVLMGLAYLFLVLLLMIGIWSFFEPSAGLWIHQDGTFTLSFEAQKNSTQWLGTQFKWFAIAISILGYFILNNTLRLLLKKTHSQSS